MAHDALRASTEPCPGGVCVRLEGELDIATAPRADEALRGAEADRPGLLAADLAGLSFMDSTGLRLIVAAAERAKEAGRRFVIVRGPDAVHRVLELTGVDAQLDVVNSL